MGNTAEPLLCPYKLGTQLVLLLQEGAGSSRPVTAEIVKVFTPFTLSCVVLVKLDHDASKGEDKMILKLFDRRFATQLREDEGVDPWIPEMESQYQKFVHNGSASDFLARLDSISDLVEKEGETWDDAQNEVYLYHLMDRLYQTEREVYRRLNDVQGKDVPILAGVVSLLGQVPNTTSDGRYDYLGCPGILLQAIEGFDLAEIPDNAPQEEWQRLCDEAIRIVNVIGDRDIRNEDVKTRSFIVERSSRRVVMIDFGLCKFREEGQTEEDWGQWKAIEDEEGAVGYVMQSRLKGGYVYHRSPKYLKLSADFMREE